MNKLGYSRFIATAELAPVPHAIHIFFHYFMFPTFSFSSTMILLAWPSSEGGRRAKFQRTFILPQDYRCPSTASVSGPSVYDRYLTLPMALHVVHLLK